MFTCITCVYIGLLLLLKHKCRADGTVDYSTIGSFRIDISTQRSFNVKERCAHICRRPTAWTGVCCQSDLIKASDDVMFGDESGWRQADLEVSAGIRIRLAPTSRLLRGNTRLINPLMNHIMWNCYIIHSYSSSFRKQRYWASVLWMRLLSLFHSNTYQPTNQTIHKNIFSIL